MNWIYRMFPMRHSLLTASFRERETASRTCAPRTPASPVLHILDPHLALAIFAAKSHGEISTDADKDRKVETEPTK
jgi:hypothetical protein